MLVTWSICLHGPASPITTNLKNLKYYHSSTWATSAQIKLFFILMKFSKKTLTLS
jgi:hypothetical protein